MRSITAGLMVTATALALGGCGPKLGDGPIKPDIYDVVQPDGKRSRMNFRGDGTYYDIEENQARASEQGTWRRSDGKLCLKPSTGGNQVCFVEAAHGTDGATLTYEGQVFTLTPASAPH